MSYKNPLGDREHAIDESYLQKENRRLIDRMQARREAAERGEVPAEAGIETVLVATDFSMHAAHATDMAIDYAKRLGAKLLLVHAYDLPIPAPSLTGSYNLSEGVLQELAEAARGQVEEAAAEIAETGVECEGIAVGAPAAIAIAKEALERNADLIVMGTRGLTGFKHFALGSVADKVLRTASCPVLTVPSPAA